jgi:hypothetical protein
MSVLKLPLLADLQQNVGELLLSETSNHSIIILENSLKQCTEKYGHGNFATGIMFLLFTCLHFGYEEF